MVKSYKGAQVPKAKPEQQLATVGDYMTTKLITFHPDQPMDEVMEKLLEKKISGGPVVDKEGHLIGIISEGDCLKEVVRGKYTNTPNFSGLVKEHMAENVITINAEMNIFEAAQKFLNMRLRRFPVVKEGKLVGQISQKDVMRAVLNLNVTTWKR
ncbi:MAG: CBS domain-containing protein [Candidatus Cyclobacteriaceae bacterium M2_1C_046]